MKLTLILLFFIIPLLHFAEGAEIVYEIQYKTNGSIKTGYIFGGFTDSNTDSIYKNHPKEFQEHMLSHGTYEDTISIHLVLHDLTDIQAKAAFPIHSFQLGSEVIHIPSNQITFMKLIKTWIKSDYHIEMLSEYRQEDTLWFNNKHNIYYPVGVEIGCRINAYEFDSSKNNKVLLKQFGIEYLKKVTTPSDYQYRKRLIQLLYQNKVIIIELCGC